MIDLSTTEQHPLVMHQKLTHPSVYLDHWALRKVSDNREKSSNLIAVVKRTGGSVALSWLNLVEFCRVSDHSQQKRAGALIDELYPNIYFLQVDPYEVLANEDRLLKGAPPFPPHADSDLMRAFFLQEQTSIRPYDAENLFQEAARLDPRTTLDSYAATVTEQFRQIRSQLEADGGAQVRRKTKVKRLPAPTRFVLREVARQILLDPSAPFDEHDAVDMLHTVVPVSYCDFVVLDKRWAAIVERAKKSLQVDEAWLSIANTFSGTKRSMDQFFAAISAHNKPIKATPKSGAAYGQR